MWYIWPVYTPNFVKIVLVPRCVIVLSWVNILLSLVSLVQVSTYTSELSKLLTVLQGPPGLNNRIIVTHKELYKFRVPQAMSDRLYE